MWFMHIDRDALDKLRYPMDFNRILDLLEKRYQSPDGEDD